MIVSSDTLNSQLTDIPKLGGRVSRRFFPFKDEQGHEVTYAKPYFSIEGDHLALHHVPVPKAPFKRATLSAADVGPLETPNRNDARSPSQWTLTSPPTATGPWPPRSRRPSKE
jgi:hypothetical protein